MDPKLFGQKIIFEVFQPLCSWYLIVTDGRSDGQTKAISSPRSALASRGNEVPLHLSHVDEYLTLKYKYKYKYSGHKYKYKYKYQVLHLWNIRIYLLFPAETWAYIFATDNNGQRSGKFLWWAPKDESFQQYMSVNDFGTNQRRIFDFLLH